MGVKVQYNPSTGDVSYNLSTGKVQVTEFLDCQYCDTPGPLEVGISDAVNLCCAFKIAPDEVTLFSEELIDIASFLNNTFLLDTLGTCTWMRIEELAAETYFAFSYENDDCSGDPGLTAEVTRIRFIYKVIQPVATPIGQLTIDFWAPDFAAWLPIQIYESTGIETDCTPSDTLVATLICPDGDTIINPHPFIDEAVVTVAVPT